MTGPSTPPRKVVRLLTAFALFFGGISAVGIAYVRLFSASGPGGGSARAMSGDQVGALFYRSIGSTPADFAGVDDDEAPQTAQYTVEIAAVTSREEADRIVERLSRAGIDCYYTPLQRKGQVIYRIRQGVFSTQNDAVAAATRLRGHGIVRAQARKL